MIAHPQNIQSYAVVNKTNKIKASTSILTLLGPTGSGKTKALQYLDTERYEIISCDSRQIYQGLQIGTAAPKLDYSAQAKENIPHHHIVCFLSPKETFSAGNFTRMARQAIHEIKQRNKIPVIVGGSRFYYFALKHGMFPVQTKLELRKQVLSLSPEERKIKLKQLNPEALISNADQSHVPEPKYYSRIHPNDDYRISRALEIILSSGKKWTTFWQEAHDSSRYREFNFHGLWIDLEVDQLKKAISARAKNMVTQGIVNEAGEVYKTYGLCPGLDTLGYSQALEVYLGQARQEDLAEKLARIHWGYARKQRSWLRKEEKEQASERLIKGQQIGSLQSITPEYFKVAWENLVKQIL